MDRLGIEMLSVFGMPPVDYVHLTADLGCRYITVGMVGFAPVKALNYPPFSLRDDPKLRRDLLVALDERGVSISLGEGLLIAPQVDVHSYAADLDVMAELHIPRINTVSLEPDRPRAFDELAALTALAADRGIRTCVEPVVGLSIADLPSAMAAVEYVNRDEISLLIDTMHVARFGATADELRAIPAERIGYIQLSDTTMQKRLQHYAEEAMFERLAPGDGELPLLDLLAALPEEPVVGLEIPMRSSAEAGVSARDRLLPCVERARSLLTELGQTD